MWVGIAVAVVVIAVVFFGLSLAKVSGWSDCTIERWQRERDEGRL